MGTRNEAGEGIRDAIPIMLGYLPLGLAFGVLANEAGLSVLEAGFMSALCFTGSGQFIAIGLLAAGGSFITIILANLLVNLRYSLFSASLVPSLKTIKPGLASALMLGLTDETYAVSLVHYTRKPATTPYILGLNAASYFSWVASSAVGASLGTMITDTARFGLNFALPSMFAILLVLVVENRKHVMVALVSIGVCLVMGWLAPATLGNLSNIVVAALVAATLGVLIKK